MPTQTRTRTLLATVGVAALLVTAGCSGTLGGTSTRAASDANGTNSIEVSATGQSEAEPNQATIRVAVVSRAENAAAARGRLSENVSRMQDALSGVVDADQVQTVRYDIDRRHRRPRPPEERRREEPAYRAEHEFAITVEQVDRTGEVIDTAVENGASDIERVEFTHSENRERELRSEALSDAMGNARGQAETLAEEANLSITGVGSVETVEGDVHGYEAAATPTAAAGDAGTSVSPGPVTVTTRVRVTYNATG